MAPFPLPLLLCPVGQHIAIIGDSLARNLFTSLLCILEQYLAAPLGEFVTFDRHGKQHGSGDKSVGFAETLWVHSINLTIAYIRCEGRGLDFSWQ